jgi:hypothetical protein
MTRTNHRLTNLWNCKMTRRYKRYYYVKYHMCNKGLYNSKMMCLIETIILHHCTDTVQSPIFVLSQTFSTNRLRDCLSRYYYLQISTAYYLSVCIGLAETRPLYTMWMYKVRDDVLCFLIPCLCGFIWFRIIYHALSYDICFCCELSFMYLSSWLLYKCPFILFRCRISCLRWSSRNPGSHHLPIYTNLQFT